MVRRMGKSHNLTLGYIEFQVSSFPSQDLSVEIFLQKFTVSYRFNPHNIFHIVREYKYNLACNKAEGALLTNNEKRRDVKIVS